MLIIEFECRGEIRTLYPPRSNQPYQFKTIEEAETLLKTFPRFHAEPQLYSITDYDAGTKTTVKTFTK